MKYWLFWDTKWIHIQTSLNDDFWKVCLFQVKKGLSRNILSYITQYPVKVIIVTKLYQNHPFRYPIVEYLVKQLDLLCNIIRSWWFIVFCIDYHKNNNFIKITVQLPPHFIYISFHIQLKHFPFRPRKQTCFLYLFRFFSIYFLFLNIHGSRTPARLCTRGFRHQTCWFFYSYWEFPFWNKQSCLHRTRIKFENHRRRPYSHIRWTVP